MSTLTLDRSTFWEKQAGNLVFFNNLFLAALDAMEAVPLMDGIMSLRDANIKEVVFVMSQRVRQRVQPYRTFGFDTLSLGRSGNE